MTSRYLGLALRWGGGALLLGLLLQQLGAREVATALSGVAPADAAAALLLAVVANTASALRWAWLATDLGCPGPVQGFLIRYAQGVSLNTVLPGATLGGDAWRGAWLAGRGHGIGRAGLTVLVDRANGLWVLCGFALAGCLSTDVAIPQVLTAAFLLALAGPLLLPVLPRLPGAAGRALGKLTPTIWARATVGSLVVQALSIAALAESARALGVDLSLSASLVLAGGLFVAAALPVSLFGFGSREAAAALLFPLFGATAAAGVAVSVLFGLLATAQGLLYLPLWLRRH